ncbi:MAG: SpoVA/SpoVAEb family sporulation membrane protein [Clostridiales bacterium]|nr:SpoVA/SpoVAEb family sporulation membrane protein [Clostridiales bacterium]
MSAIANPIEKRNARYGKYVDSVTPKTGTLKSLWNSFWVGGITCCIAQGVGDIYALIFPNFSEDMIVNITSMTIITLAILFTGLGFYDMIARKGGAGCFLPITGFANAISSAAMEYKSEGLILGTSVKMFTVVGPVVVNGVVWSTVAGILNLLILGRM